MGEELKLKTSKKNKLRRSEFVLLICALIVIYCPFLYVDMLGHYCGDTAIQIKIGLDSLKYKTFVPIERYSWHEGLNWIKHELLWYHTVGITYKIFGILGVVGLAAIFNYAIAILAFKFNYKKVHPLILVATACVGRIMSFPNMNARPNLFSQLAFTVLVITMLSNKSTKFKCISFMVIAFLCSWFHGGMLSLMFVCYILFIVIELVYKNYKTAGYLSLALVGGFLLTLCNPVGITSWIYPFKMTSEGAKFEWSQVQEWFPKTFTLLEITLILLLYVGFAVDERLRKFDKNTIIRICFLSMFLIISCKHCRFMNYTALVIVLLCAEEYQILLNWINDNVFKIRKEIFNFSDFSYYIIAVFCLGFAIFTTVFSVITYFPTNTMSDCSRIEAYDEGVIDCIKEKGYTRIYNNFDTGTWLAFYDVKVHIDNRTDLYLPQFSGENYLEYQMVMDNIHDVDNFYEKYSPDAFVLELFPGTTDEYLIQDMINSDRYTVVYDNYYESNRDPSVGYRWMVFECNYAAE